MVVSTDIRLETEDKLKDMLTIFYDKKPRVHVKSGLTGFTRNFDTFSNESMVETEFQPIGDVDGRSIVVYRTHDGASIGYGIFDETNYSILIIDIIGIITQIMPDEEGTYDQLASLSLLVESMENLLDIHPL